MAPIKRIKLDYEALKQNDSSSDSEESVIPEAEEMEEIEEYSIGSAQPPDSYGIKNLLHQLFFEAHINIPELTDLLVSQEVTGVVKPFDSHRDLDPENLDAFGLLTVVNITEHSSTECINQIHLYLLSHGKKRCADAKFQMLRRILEDDEKHVGLIISERTGNIPATMAVPLYSDLSYYLTKVKNPAFNLEYLILISKIIVSEDDSKQKNVHYKNAEDTFIAEVATLSYDISVSSKFDSGLAGNWTNDDSKGKRKHRVLLFPASELEHVYNKILESPI